MLVLHCLLTPTLAAGIPSQPLKEVQRGTRVKESRLHDEKERAPTHYSEKEKKSESGVAVVVVVYKAGE